MTDRWYHDGKHPLWTIAIIVTITGAAVVLSLVNATSFDWGEGRTVIGTATVAGLGKIIYNRLTS